MKDFSKIPKEIAEQVLDCESMAIWPIDEMPMSDSYQIARYFQDRFWDIYPLHDYLDRILDVDVYRDLRLIPDDYDILVLFCNPDQLPIIVNAIFNADFVPSIVWMHEGIKDLDSYDRLTEGGIKVVMDFDIRDFFEWHENLI